MKTLKKDWVTDGIIDFEHKKYVLLAYLQAVQVNFGQKKLYPDLTELRQHYQYSLAFQQQKLQLTQQLGKHLAGIDWQRLALLYENSFSEDEFLAGIEEIVRFSLPKFQWALGTGQEILEEVEENLTVSPVGIVPLHTQEGYLFIYEHIINETRIYNYRITLFDNEIPPTRRMQTTHVDTVKKSVGMTFENLKLDLVRKRKELPNPASYIVECRMSYPMEETLLPVAKKKAVGYILGV